MVTSVVFENIKNWCEKNSIKLIKGSLDTKSRIYAQIFLIEEEDYSSFLGIAKCNNINEIIYSSLAFDSETEFEELGEYNIPEIIDGSFQTVIEYDESICITDLYITVNGSIYNFQYVEDWYSEFLDKVSVFLDSQNKLTEEFRLPELASQTINLIVRKIAESDLYFAYHTRPNRFNYVFTSVMKEMDINPHGYTINLFYLEKMVNKLFLDNYKHNKEKRYVDLIINLKEQGKTKIAIISILEITAGIFDNLSNK